MQKSVQKILYRHSFAADFWGGSFVEVVCVFEVFVIAFCFGEFVGVFVLRFLCLLLVEIERVMKRWDLYKFCCYFFFFPGFFGWGLFWWVAQISRWWMKKLLLWSSQVFLGPVDGKSGAKQASCKGFWPNPTTLLCFSSSSSSSFGSVWSVLDAKTIQKSCNCGKDKPEYAKHFTYKPIIIIIIFFFSANFKK